MTHKCKFVGFGELGVDKLYDENLNLMLVEGGDTTWNILYNLGIMGEECYAVGVVGNDKEGNIAINSLKHAGVNTDNVTRQTKPTNIMNSVSKPNIQGGTDVTFSVISPVTKQTTFELSKEIPTSVPKDLEDSQAVVVIMHLDEQYRQFFSGIRNRKVALDLGHSWIFEQATPQYIIQYLNEVDVCQINGNVLMELCQKLGVSSKEELFRLFSPDLLILTYGSKGAQFLFQTGNEVTQLSRRPKHIVSGQEIVDTSGAGDAFFSVFLKGYRRNLESGKPINEQFIDTTFPIASAFSSQIIKQKGCRGTSRILAAILAQRQAESKGKDIEVR